MIQNKKVCGKSDSELGAMKMDAKKTGGFSEWPVQENDLSR